MFYYLILLLIYLFLLKNFIIHGLYTDSLDKYFWEKLFLGRCTNLWDGLGEYIKNLGEGRENFKVVEIGVGKFFDISNYLIACESIDLIKVDINPADSSVVKDDIMEPDLSIYEGVDLIYSIRPPYEIQPYLIDLSEKVNSSIIIKPLSGEDLNVKGKNMHLKNFKKVSFYIYP